MDKHPDNHKISSPGSLSGRSGWLGMLIFLITLSPILSGQQIYVPLSHWIYDQLDRWETRGLIENVYNHTRPYTRSEVAEYLEEVFEAERIDPDRLSRHDREFLAYCREEFREALEARGISPESAPSVNRFRAIRDSRPLRWLPDFLYQNNRNLYAKEVGDFTFRLDPVAQYSRYQTLGADDTVSTTERISNGLLAYGTLGHHFGFYFNLTDNHFSRDPGYPLLEVLEESGLPYHTVREPESFDVDENAAYMTLHHRYFTLLYGRDYNQWGSGRHGQLMLSTNAPIYDQLKFSIRYWRFKYTHVTAFLQYIPPEGRRSIKSFEPVDVYWAGNRLEIYLGKGVQLGFQESIVYGNQGLKPGYLNPLAFFKSLEHFYGDRDNGGLGIDLAWRVRDGVRLHGEWFIDDILTGKLGSDFFGNKFGYIAGLFLADPLGASGTDLLVEYARVKPYVYSHRVQDYNKYKHYDTVMGHFIGPNSDDLYVQLRHAPTRRLRLQASFESYRHGSNLIGADSTVLLNVGGDADLPHRVGDPRDAPFLDGERISRRIVGVEARYEFLRNCFLTLRYHRADSNSSGVENLFALRLSFNLGQREELMPAFQPALR